MAFSDFQYPQVFAQLGLTEATAPNLFAGVPPVPPTPATRQVLDTTVRLATAAHTEASRATWIVGPVLADLWGRYGGQLNLIAGAELVGDRDAGLAGYCDFLLGRGPQMHHRVRAPVAVIFEAKRDSIPDGLGQCVAGMVGVQRFNRREGSDVDPVYGCVTTGSQWRFLALAGTALTFDATEYTIHQADRILGILSFIVGPLPHPAAA